MGWAAGTPGLLPVGTAMKRPRSESVRGRKAMVHRAASLLQSPWCRNRDAPCLPATGFWCCPGSESCFTWASGNGFLFFATKQVLKHRTSTLYIEASPYNKPPHFTKTAEHDDVRETAGQRRHIREPRQDDAGEGAGEKGWCWVIHGGKNPVTPQELKCLLKGTGTAGKARLLSASQSYRRFLFSSTICFPNILQWACILY